MLFLTVVLFIYYLITLINGGLFKGKIIESGELKIKYDRKEITKKEFDDAYKDIGLIFICFIIPFLIINLIYMLLSFSHKQFALISVCYFVLYIIWTFAFSKVKKKNYDLTNDKDLATFRKKLYKGRSFKEILWDLISLAYFGYIGYLLLLT